MMVKQCESELNPPYSILDHDSLIQILLVEIGRIIDLENFIDQCGLDFHVPTVIIDLFQEFFHLTCNDTYVEINRWNT